MDGIHKDYNMLNKVSPKPKLLGWLVNDKD
jgi:hypothetical protein